MRWGGEARCLDVFPRLEEGSVRGWEAGGMEVLAEDHEAGCQLLCRVVVSVPCFVLSCLAGGDFGAVYHEDTSRSTHELTYT